MLAKPLGLMLTDLGILKSHSRPYCSNDNPFVESHFRTLKYRPEFSDRFGSLCDARQFCQLFFQWYHYQHRHSGLGWMSPHSVHHGQAQQVRGMRQEVLEAAFQKKPERFVRKHPQAPQAPSAVWINPPHQYGQSAEKTETTHPKLDIQVVDPVCDCSEVATEKDGIPLNCMRFSHEEQHPSITLDNLQSEVNHHKPMFGLQLNS